MPKRTDIETILIIGSGPIVIGQACEFDYSGTQACKALRSEGYRIVLVNSNPATIMTDPMDMADRTYIEPIIPEVVEKIIAIERPQAILPTLGGQTGLNTAVQLYDMGILDRYHVEMIGATREVINKAENRALFKQAMQKIGLNVPASGLAHSMEEAEAVIQQIGLPCVIRPAYTLGGSGGKLVFNRAEYKSAIRAGLAASPISEVLVEESVVGWKEYELEVMRDRKDNVVIVCSIENFDPMGVHTGDSITVAPAQTLTDKEYQLMRDASIAIIREIGVETGGSNIQFATHPQTGKMVVIEMNPRVSRSSALASKATGFPIAKFAAKLAVGYTLDEIPNDITRKTPACFEPTIDYCVTKIPRWAFEKFRSADTTLTVQMKSVGEVMAIGRTFKESLQKAIRSLEIGRFGLGPDAETVDSTSLAMDEIIHGLVTPTQSRLYYIRHALRRGMDIQEVMRLSHVDPWFLKNIQEICEHEHVLEKIASMEDASDELFFETKRMGFSDVQIAHLWNTTEQAVREERLKRNIKPTYKLVDTCAAEFDAYTPYYYSTYETEDEARVSDRKKIVILGSGPNRIGQGIEFDYCCVHASFALKEIGYETIMINANPETVSTDYDTSDQLYFEPLTVEDVLAVIDRQKPEGVIVQFGGQTPLNLARTLQDAGVPIIGTSVDSIDKAEDRKQFKVILDDLGLKQPANDTVHALEDAVQVADRIGYPVVVRPSFVLGGRAMEIAHDRNELSEYVREAIKISNDRPILIDKFLEDAVEVDVDAVCDGIQVVIGGIMEHIEEAGVHSGDSACALPPYSLPERVIEEIRSQTRAMAMALEVKGLMNVQYAVKGEEVYVLEVNPRASRTVPFVSKATGVPMAKVAAKVMAGMSLEEIGFTREVKVKHVSVKESVLPFMKFPDEDIILGPEMKSTGEVMGCAEDFGSAFAKSQLAANQTLPLEGTIFISVKDRDKGAVIMVAKRLEQLGFRIVSTRGTTHVLRENDITVESVLKIKEGRPNILDMIMNNEIHMVVNTPSGKGPRTDEARIRRTATARGIPCVTTIAAASASASGIEALKRRDLQVRALQDYHQDLLSSEVHA